MISGQTNARKAAAAAARREAKAIAEKRAIAEAVRKLEEYYVKNKGFKDLVYQEKESETPNKDTEPKQVETELVQPKNQTLQSIEKQQCVLTAPAKPGDNRLEVNSTLGRSVGEIIVINRGMQNSELVTVAGFGSILLQRSLRFHHQIGEIVEPAVANVDINYIVQRAKNVLDEKTQGANARTVKLKKRRKKKTRTGIRPKKFKKRRPPPPRLSISKQLLGLGVSTPEKFSDVEADAAHILTPRTAQVSLMRKRLEKARNDAQNITGLFDKILPVFYKYQSATG